MNARGPTAARLELAERAAALRAQGLVIRAIAAELGVSRSYADALVNDPDGAHARARKDRYQGVCIDCSSPTSGSLGRALAPERCQACRKAFERSQKYWTRERVIDAIQRFATEHGRPPRAEEWQYAHTNDGYPASSSVYRTTTTTSSPFATWNEAISAAGFEPIPVGRHDRTGERGLHELTRLVLAWLREQTEPATIPEFCAAHPRPVKYPRHAAGDAMRALVRRGLAVKVRQDLGQGGRAFYLAVKP